MNYQRKLIRKVCVVGVSSALIASMGAMDPTTAFPEGHVLAAEVEEEKFWEDMTEEERMALPEEERERLKAEAEKRAEEVRLYNIQRTRQGIQRIQAKKMWLGTRKMESKAESPTIWKTRMKKLKTEI